MDIDATFLPVAIELIDNVFPTAITYKRDAGSTYDPATGTVTPSITEYTINAGVLGRSRIEDGGVAEIYELQLWVHHNGDGLPYLPTTSDTLVYDSETWKVIDVSPTYSSSGLIASKIKARSKG